MIAPAATHADIRARFAPETPVILFADHAVADAVTYVLEHRPPIIALDLAVACSIRGRTLINTFLGEPHLAGCEVRVIGARAAASTEPFDLDPACRRSTPRVRTTAMHVHLDGVAADLVDVSPFGAQILSTAAVRPNQRVRAVLGTPGQGVVRVEALVVWAAYELPAGRPPRYRVGLQFTASPAIAARVEELLAHG